MAKRRVTHHLDTTWGRLRAWLHFYLKDHQIIRLFWTNLAEFAPEVFRSNQPSPRRLAALQARGLRTVVSLRGAARQSFNLLEERACAELGLTFVRLQGITARRPVPAATMLAVVDRLATLETPLLIHCKSGADRTGLVAALYLILVKGVDVEEAARSQLARRWIHFPRSRAGVLDHIFRVYLRDAAPAGQGFRDWLETVYDPDTLQADFNDWRGKRGRWAT